MSDRPDPREAAGAGATAAPATAPAGAWRPAPWGDDSPVIGYEAAAPWLQAGCGHDAGSAPPLPPQASP